jgi:hypothetical protein
MGTRKYIGTCQCGRVRYEAEIDFSTAGIDHPIRGDSRTALIKSSAFRLLSGAADLADNQFGVFVGYDRACRYCGIRLFGKGRLTALGGDVYAINLATLDVLASQALAG